MQAGPTRDVPETAPSRAPRCEHAGTTDPPCTQQPAARARRPRLEPLAVASPSSSSCRDGRGVAASVEGGVRRRPETRDRWSARVDRGPDKALNGASHGCVPPKIENTWLTASWQPHHINRTAAWRSRPSVRRRFRYDLRCCLPYACEHVGANNKSAASNLHEADAVLEYDCREDARKERLHGVRKGGRRCANATLRV